MSVRSIRGADSESAAPRLISALGVGQNPGQTPWSGPRGHPGPLAGLRPEADEGVGRRPGGLPHKEADELVREILETHAGLPCLTCSFQAEDMVVLDILRKLSPDIPVLFLDTGYHFAETYAYRDRMTRQWNLNVVNLTAAMPVAEQESIFGKLYGTHPDQCCKARKVEPLLRALAEYDVWFTGLRREQSATRANLAQVETHTLPGGKELQKVSPLAFWTWREVWSYLRINEIEYLPLYDSGYTSIGCEPCTQLPLDGGNPRSGRWAGRKLECGIHTFDAGKEGA